MITPSSQPQITTQEPLPEKATEVQRLTKELEETDRALQELNTEIKQGGQISETQGAALERLFAKMDSITGELDILEGAAANDTTFEK